MCLISQYTLLLVLDVFCLPACLQEFSVERHKEDLSERTDLYGTG